MTATLPGAFQRGFLGNAPAWYKATVAAFLVLNPLIAWTFGPVAAGWAVLLEFIFTLAMALRCYPLQPGGLLALEALFIGMTTPHAVYEKPCRRCP
jgi:NhaB family Na+:H+ antiporter